MKLKNTYGLQYFSNTNTNNEQLANNLLTVQSEPFVRCPTGVPAGNARAGTVCHQLPRLLPVTRCILPSLKSAQEMCPKGQETEISPPTEQGLSFWIFYCEQLVGWNSLSSLTNPLCKQPIIKSNRISGVLNLAHVWFQYT